MSTAPIRPKIPIPPFAALDLEMGVTELRVRSVIGRRFTRVFRMSLIAALILLIILLNLFQFQAIARSDLWGWFVAAETICGLALFASAMVCMAYLMATVVRAKVLFNGKKLRLQDTGATYEIPLEQICSIRQVQYSTTRLELNHTDRPKPLLFRGRKTALEITTPEGRIEFFRSWGENEVAWLCTSVHRLLFPGGKMLSPEEVDPAERNDVVIATRIYGHSRRLLFWSSLIAGMAATAISGWFVVQGLKSRNWPGVQGQVVYSLWERNADGTHAEIKYTYRVQGITYTSDGFGFGRDAGDSIVRQFVVDHPDSSAITVYFNPARPADSVVITGLGSIYWVICPLGPILLATGLPLGLRRTTAAQDALAKRYKINSQPRHQDFKDPTILIRWSMTEDVRRGALRSARKVAMTMALRLLAFTALMLWAAHHWIGPFCSPDLRWGMVSTVMMGMAGLQAISLVAGSRIGSRAAPSYGLAEEGILLSSKTHRLLSWKSIASFTVQPDLHRRDRQILSLHLASAVRRDLYLPGGSVDDAILAELSKHLRQSPPPPSATPLSLADLIVSLLLTGAFVAGVILFGRVGDHYHRVTDASYLLIVAILAGPGSWIALGLRKRRKLEQVILLAMSLNIVMAMAVIMKRIMS